MGDIFVHLRMKKCCRNTLKELDTHKKKAKHKNGVLGVKSLFDMFSEKTIDAAKAEIPASAWGKERDIEALTRAACEKICIKHADEHTIIGEMEEGGFWSKLAMAIQGNK